MSKLVVHLVFTTLYRRKLFTDVMIGQLREAVESASVKLECELIEMDGEQNHVHLLISYPPKRSISVMVNNLKAVSSRLLRLQNTHLTRQSKRSVLWSRTYFACTAGAPTIETLRGYIAYLESQSTLDYDAIVSYTLYLRPHRAMSLRRND